MGRTLHRIAAAALAVGLSAAPLVVPELAEAKSRKGKAARKAEPPPKEKPADPPPRTAEAPKKGGGADPGDPDAIRRGERVEFDERLIQGQTAKAGAVYLFERMSSDLRSMVKERSSYRDEVVEVVFPPEGAR